MNLFRNPVLTKEVRGRMRGNRAMLIMTIYLGIIGFVTMLVYLALINSMPLSTNDPAAGSRVGKAIFITVMFVALAQVSVITPSLTAGSIAGEKERQSYDLLITTLLPPWNIALGKMIAALAFASLLIIAVLPLAGLAFLFGGVSGMELLIGVLGLFVTSVLYASVGMFWSTVMRSTQGAMIMSQGSILLWLAGIPFLAVVTGAILSNSMLIDWPPFIYAAGAVLYAHPFIALGVTQFQLMDGENPFFFTFSVDGTQLLAPSPWIIYSAIGLVLTCFFLLLSMRLILPVQYAPGKGRKARRTARTVLHSADSSAAAAEPAEPPR